jgi:hypothetical protein
MKLKVGDKITAEGLDFEKMEDPQKISLTIDEEGAENVVYISEAATAIETTLPMDAVRSTEAIPAMAAEGGFVQTFEKADPFKLEENEILFPAEKITANDITIELHKLMTKSTVAEAIKFETKTIKGTVKEMNDFGIKINGEDNKVYVIPTAMFAEAKEYKSMNLKIGDNITAEGPDFEKMMGKMKNQKGAVFFSTPAIASAKAELKELPEDASIKDKDIIVRKFDKANMLKLEKDDIMFSAEKISANGVTVDINKLMMELHKPIQIKMNPRN